DKLDWFLEDEDGWLEPWQAANQETDEETYSTSKRPLDAVSLRVAPSVSSSVEHSQGSLDDEEWPEESSFRVDRWERNEPVNDDVNFQSLPNKRREPSRSARRPLPRSSRRRF
ncbi:MAG: RNA helicase, partial [Prochlorococcaceae cyanobacterium ETNP1_MAG_9]|nr:RNA helicase [Prochlorococcaceae cyanobacterium ETNP1_MAG_9]